MTPLQIRWLIRRDTDDVLAIERESSEHPWDEEELCCHLRQRNCIGVVAEEHRTIRGFMVYELHKNSLQILNFAVAREHRRVGIGRAMVQRLIDKLDIERRYEITLEIPETNLDGQLFFVECGFRATAILPGRYRMRYSLEPQKTIVRPSIPLHLRNVRGRTA